MDYKSAGLLPTLKTNRVTDSLAIGTNSLHNKNKTSKFISNQNRWRHKQEAAVSC